MNKAYGIVSAAILILAAAAPASAEEAKSPQKPKDKMICKRTTQIGTLAVAKKMCHTKAEWDQMRADGRDATANAQAQGFTNCEGADPNGANC